MLTDQPSVSDAGDAMSPSQGVASINLPTAVGVVTRKLHVGLAPRRSPKGRTSRLLRSSRATTGGPERCRDLCGREHVRATDPAFGSRTGGLAGPVQKEVGAGLPASVPAYPPGSG